MTREPELIDAYGILEVEIGAPEPAVRAAYHARLDVWHPDKHQNDRERAEIACDRIVGAFALIERNGFPPANQVPPKLSRVPTPRPGTPRPGTPLPRASSQPGETTSRPGTPRPSSTTTKAGR